MKKDPDARLDYGWDWTAWLVDDDTIATAEIIGGDIEDGVTVEDTTHDDTTVTTWVSGGTVGRSYTLVCRITTTSGRTDDRTLRITIADR